MRYIIINPKAETVKIVDCESLDKATHEAGLEPLRVDHGTIAQGLSAVVYEYSLFESEHYFAIGGQLFGGNAVLYGYNQEGKTIDITFSQLNKVERWILFYHGPEQIEAAIADNTVVRPKVKVNDELIWQWGEKP